jgi:hypothetical protein
MIKYIAIAAVALFVFLSGFNCGRNAVDNTAFWGNDTVTKRWTTDSTQHAEKEVVLVPTGGQIPTGALKVSKPVSNTQIGIEYKVPCPEQEFTIDTTISLANLGGFKSGNWGTDSISNVIKWITSKPDTIRLRDNIGVLHYWKGRRLLVDVTSEKGFVQSLKSVAVYKEPLPFMIGPSITAFYDGKTRIVPGISVVYDIRHLFRSH